MILSNYKPKKSPFWLFLKQKQSKIYKIGVLVAKNHQNLKKIQRSIFIPKCRKLNILQHCATSWPQMTMPHFRHYPIPVKYPTVMVLNVVIPWILYHLNQTHWYPIYLLRQMEPLDHQIQGIRQDFEILKEILHSSTLMVFFKMVYGA